MPITYRRRLTQGVSIITLLAVLPAMPLHAQQAETSPIVLDTIIITGDNIARDLMETPSSVSVVTAQELEREKNGKDEVRTVIQGTPNVLYTDNVSTPVIRGQDAQGPHTGGNAFFAGSVPRATINLDGHYLSYNELYFGATSSWDVDSIEVFRGPQTTSQGANAIAGAIIVNTKDPSFTPEGAYRIEAGNYNQRRASVAWSAPITEELAARVALDYSGRDSFIDYVSPNFVQNEIGQEFMNANARVKLLWEPAEIAGLSVKLTYSHSRMKRPSAEGAAEPFDDLNSITNWMPAWDQTSQTAMADVDYDLGNGLVVSSKTQYSISDVKRRVGTENFGDANVDQDNYSNETKLNYGTLDDQFSGVAGVYLAFTDQDEWIEQGGDSTFRDRKSNVGVYGELNWRIDDRWTLAAGLRYQRDHIRRAGEVSPAFANSNLDYEHTFDAVLPKLTLSYQVTPDWLVGGLVSKGYNPGGISLDFAGSRDWTEFEEESVWNYELYTRSELLDGRLLLTGNLFYMDYTNAQHNITTLVDGITQIQTVNAKDAEAYGLEISADYRPIDSLTLRGSVGLLHTEFKTFSQMPAYEGNEFARSPGKMFSLGASWDATDKLNLGGQVRYIDGYYSNTANTPAYEVDGFTLVDVSASYRVNDRVEFYGYVNNLLDERAPTLREPARGDVIFTQASMTAPRMVGVGLRGRF